MRRFVLVLAAALMLSGCVSSLQSAYDDRAREECERESRGHDRLNC